MLLNKNEIQTYKYSMEIAVDWLMNIAQKKEESLIKESNSHNLKHNYWKGSIRGEYSLKEKKWDYFCPIWHTGQAIKSFAYSYKIFGENKYLNAALLGAEFIIRNSDRNKESEDFGLIYAFEDYGDFVNTSAILECIDGLFHLSDLLIEFDDDELEELKVLKSIEKYDYNNFYDAVGYIESIGLNALRWVRKKMYLPEFGLFWDLYSPELKKIKKLSNKKDLGVEKGKKLARPLADDSVFLKAKYRTHDKQFSRIYRRVLDRLVADEAPNGNWICWGPANKLNGTIHPRHAYWWGSPFIYSYKEYRDKNLLRIGISSAEWYIHAMRKDGGIFRGTYLDFNTDSFGHATSGSACGAILFNELRTLLFTDDDARKNTSDLGYNVDELIIELNNNIKKALSFCRNMQLTMPNDEDLYGVIVEKLKPLNGSDGNPIYIRDLGTIFYIQACYEIIKQSEIELKE
jgi:hypothetical protein